MVRDQTRELTQTKSSSFQNRIIETSCIAISGGAARFKKSESIRAKKTATNILMCVCFLCQSDDCGTSEDRNRTCFRAGSKLVVEVDLEVLHGGIYLFHLSRGSGGLLSD